MSRDVAEGSGLLTRASTYPEGRAPCPVTRTVPPEGGSAARAPHEELRHARSAGPGACLRRREPNEPERLPSDRPGSRDPSRPGRVRCSLTRLRPRTLSLAASLGHLVKGWLVASSYPSPRASPRVAPDRCPRSRKMRLTDFCNRPTTRAPCRLPDSRVRDLPAPPGALAGAVSDE
jgi:hypothetical protein